MTDEPGWDVPETDREIFNLINKVRADPKDFIPFCEDLITRYEGLLIKQQGRVTIRTKEGPQAVHEAIDYLRN